jgi:hypothetical protein
MTNASKTRAVQITSLPVGSADTRYSAPRVCKHSSHYFLLHIAAAPSNNSAPFENRARPPRRRDNGAALVPHNGMASAAVLQGLVPYIGPKAPAATALLNTCTSILLLCSTLLIEKTGMLTWVDPHQQRNLYAIAALRPHPRRCVTDAQSTYHSGR